MGAAILDITIYKGATFRRVFTLSVPNPDPLTAPTNPTVPVNLSGYSFRAAIKPETNDRAVPTAVFSFGLDPDPTTGKFTMEMPAEVTENIPSSGKYYEQTNRYTWDLELIAPSGEVSRLFHGFAFVSPRTSRIPS